MARAGAYAALRTVELAPWRPAGCPECCEVRLIDRPGLKHGRYAVEWRGPLICGGFEGWTYVEALARRDGVEMEADARAWFSGLRCRHP